MSSAETGAVRPGNAKKEVIRQNLSSLPYFFLLLYCSHSHVLWIGN